MHAWLGDWVGDWIWRGRDGDGLDGQVPAVADGFHKGSAVR